MREFLRLCLAAGTPRDRWFHAKEFLRRTLEGELRLYGFGDTRTHEDGSAVDRYTELLSGWLFELDAAFNVVAVFNAAEGRTDGAFVGVVDAWGTAKHHKTFYVQKACFPGMLATESFLYEPAGLCDDFIRDLVGPVPRLGQVGNPVLLNLARKHGFVVFNLTAFRIRAAAFSYDPGKAPLGRDLLGAVSRSLSQAEKEKLHWLYFVLVERLKGQYGVNGATRKVGELCKVQNKRRTKKGKLELIFGPTVRSRYYERKSALKKIKLERPDYGIDDIIRDHNLQPVVDETLSLSVDLSVTGKQNPEGPV